MASPSRQARGRLAGEATQCLAGCVLREPAFDQRFRARGGKTRLVGLDGQQGFVLAVSFLLQPNDLVVLLAAWLVDLFAALTKWMSNSRL